MKTSNLFENRTSIGEFLWIIFLLALCIYFLVIRSIFFFSMLIALGISLVYTKKIILNEEEILIKYPFIPYLKKAFPLCEIEKITFKSSNASASPQVLIIHLVNGRKSRNYFFGGLEFQELINLLRDRGKDVEVISILWE